MMRSCLSRLALAGLVPLLAAADKPPPTAEQVKFFEQRVRPVLVQRCQNCHGPDKAKSGLRVDSLAALIKGGEHGPALDLDKPEASLLLNVIGSGEPFAMPPKEKLPQRQRDDLAAWVKMGAPWPSATIAVRPPPEPGKPLFTADERKFWAFRTPINPGVPKVQRLEWHKNAIDSHILSGLEAKGLSPAPPADRRTLLRRVTFDLIGLPPTPEEIDAFLKDQRPDAFARVVDRLLASPRYGERWGRHWLDVARYADSNGMDENLAFGNAWRYRDYVIKAFNDDKPYDQFVIEQLAGDLLPASADPAVNSERLTATGFLCIGPKMLAEDDPVKMEMDIVDEQVDTMGRAFLGLTLGCGRCHDHKFDPIPTADYYSLAGIFRSTKTMLNFNVVAQWQERPLADPATLARQKEHQDKVGAVRARLQQRREAILKAAVADLRQHKDEYLLAAGELLRQSKVGLTQQPQMNDPEAAKKPGVIVIEAEDFQRGNVMKDFNHYGVKIGVIYNKGELPNVAEYDLKRDQASLYQLELRYAAADARPVEISVNGQLVKQAGASERTGTWFPDTQRFHVECLVVLRQGDNTIKLLRNGPFPHIDKLALVPRTLPPGAAQLVVKTVDQWAAEKRLSALVLSQLTRYLEAKKLAADAAGFDKALNDPKGPFGGASMADRLADPVVAGDLKKITDEVTALEKATPQLPQAMAVMDGKVGNLRVHLRGNHLTLGAAVPRQFPRLLAGENQTPIANSTSGRLELARWLVQPDNPLTVRVMVNRLWRWHFGTGLVRSVDNFGRLGERPSHPVLLDYLACRFIESGWSIKAMHRLIVLSSTYQMSTTPNEKGALIDPENRLLWRKERRRLEAESIRDALLAVSGQIEQGLGGSLLRTPNRAYVASTFSVDVTNYESNRRSVYLPVVRSALYEVFQAFDFTDPSTPNGDRATTTVAPQALFMMNSKLVQSASKQWAINLLARAELDDAGRVRLAYEQAYGRPAEPREVERAVAFLGRSTQAPSEVKTPDAERHTHAWQSLCKTLLAANEFVYVE